MFEVVVSTENYGGERKRVARIKCAGETVFTAYYNTGKSHSECNKLVRKAFAIALRNSIDNNFSGLIAENLI